MPLGLPSNSNNTFFPLNVTNYFVHLSLLGEIIWIQEVIMHEFLNKF